MKLAAVIMSTSLAAVFCVPNAMSHDQSVHMQITSSALNYATRPGSGANTFSSLTAFDGLTLQDMINYTIAGSSIEDDYDAIGGQRTFNHFYDPLTRNGLSNIPIDEGMQVGRDSFTWGSTLFCSGYDFWGVWCVPINVNTFNQWSWPDARAEEGKRHLEN